MTVAELIAELQKLPQDKVVEIADGYNTKFYRGSWEVRYHDWADIVEIGIGGTQYEPE